jgi:hypothetical protein
MEIIRKFIEPVVTDTLLTKEQAIIAFDLFVQGGNVNSVKHQLHVPASKVETLYQRLVEIREMIERVVKGEAKLVHEEGHYDREGNYIVDTPTVYAAVPNTLEDLQSTCLALVANDYDISEPLFETDNLMDLVDGLNYVIEKIIQYSNATNDASFDWWKFKIIENGNI